MNDKQRVAKYAAGLVEDGMQVGLGTGSTANFFIEELARRMKEDGLKIMTVASSKASEDKARQLGLPQVSIEKINALDLYVDGADEVAPDLTLLKGQGADLVKEKLLATAADRFLVLVDRSKLVEHIGQLFAIPIEIIPFAWPLTQKSLEKLGGTGNLRKNAAGDGFAISSHGSLIADIRFDRNMDISELDAKLKQMPGVVEHGIFQGLASSVFVGADGQLKELGAGGL